MKTEINGVLLSLLYFCLVLSGGWFCPFAEGQNVDLLPTQKRVIHAGWDMPSTEYMRNNWKQMDEIPAFDGFMFRVAGKTDEGKQVAFTGAFSPEKWKLEWFDQARKDLAECQFKKLTRNFLMVYGTPGTISWNDQEGWKNLTEKMGMAAKIAKEGKAIGLCLDFESYGKQQFKFEREQGLTWAEAKQRARQYGRDFMNALAKEFPDAVILTYWMNSMHIKAGMSAEPDAVLMADGYGLLPFFFDGMLDVIPPTITMIDGAEKYFLEGPEFTRAAQQMRQWNGPCARLFSPENRAKYRAQVQAGFGFYLDMYTNPEGNIYYRGPMDGGGTRLDRLVWNLGAALDAADEYVWVYGEKCRWFGAVSCNEFKVAPHKTFEAFGLSWESQLPGITQSIAWLKDPEAACDWKMKQLEESGKLVNLAVNGAFTEGEAGKTPRQYGFWQIETHPNGTVAFDKDVTYPGNPGGSCRFEKMYNGCLISKLAVKPGERYCVRAKSKTEGEAIPQICTRWQNEKGAWTRESDDVSCIMKPLNDDSGWSRASGAVTVPDGCFYIVTLLSVNQQSDDSKVWFDDLEVYRIDE